MWKLRSGLSNKTVKFKPSSEANEGVPEDLQEFWQVASPLIEAWAEDFLAKRFY